MADPRSEKGTGGLSAAARLVRNHPLEEKRGQRHAAGLRLFDGTWARTSRSELDKPEMAASAS